MDELDRAWILKHFTRGELPARPETVAELMNVFVASSFSYAPLRRYLARVIGRLPDRTRIPECLAKVFDEPAFLGDENWSPEKMLGIAEMIQSKHLFNLDSRKFEPRMTAVLLTGSPVMAERLADGLEAFYDDVERHCVDAEHMWRYAQEFSRKIKHVAAALTCDFLKSSGFTRFVKIDHHLRREFPELVLGHSRKQLSLKDSFALAIDLAELLGMTPFHLDHLLYQWGRYKKHVHSD